MMIKQLQSLNKWPHLGRLRVENKPSGLIKTKTTTYSYNSMTTLITGSLFVTVAAWTTAVILRTAMDPVVRQKQNHA